MHLSDAERLTAGDVLLVASALVALITVCGLAWQRVVRPVRAAARAAFAHSVAEAARAAVTDELVPIAAQVSDLHAQLSAHLLSETAEIAGIHTAVSGLGDDMRGTFERRTSEFETGVRPWRERFEALEASHDQILARLDGMAAQAATDSAKVIQAVADAAP